MRILVTGGAGYVGSACLRYLLGHGEDAVAYDNLSAGHRAAVPADRLIVGDIRDQSGLVSALRDTGAQAVMHFAALAYVGESVIHPQRYYENNVAGSLSVLQAMRSTGVSRLVFSSTCATYGITGHDLISESLPQEPVNPYGRTKLAVEWMIRDCAAAYGFGYTLLRYFNAAGAAADGQHGEDHDPEPHLLPLVLQCALGQKETLQVYGNDYDTPDGTCIRDYIHVDDLASAHWATLQRIDSGTAQVYNIGTGTGYSVLEVIAVAERVTGRSIEHKIAPRRPGDPARLVADPQKLIAALGWQPTCSKIETIVANAWQWHQTHPHGYAS
ncbi:MAG: UDP-glucose 4-epimerase GalE [Gammaproteobacteria bacterium]|nr:UDP-glucose 4-epimerase GalE [Gammaproteobacteria bacterium]MDH3467094.1 UDP-glucose 4-epimerase GalE [Gammaproteobacteria bacterium]